VLWGSKCLPAENGRKETNDFSSLNDSESLDKQVAAFLKDTSGGSEHLSTVSAARSFCQSPKAQGKKIRICFVIEAFDRAVLEKRQALKEKEEAHGIMDLDLEELISRL
jgi:hypothetical protein